MVHNGITPEGGTKPSDPIEWVWVQRFSCKYVGGVSSDHYPTPIKRGLGLHVDYPLTTHPGNVMLVAPLG
jgi:hypothetical protein